MGKGLGIGGVFFKAEDPQAVRDWYARVLGFEISKWGGVEWPHPEAGQGNWTVFPTSSDYFNPSTAPFMVNYVVEDIDGVLAKAKAEGAEALGREDSEYGRFAWLMDPAGVKIELWEPAAEPDTA